MPINQRNKTVIISLAFLILVVLIFSGSGLTILRPVPSSLTQYPTPGAPRPIPSNFPPPASPTPTPRFGATWGQRLRPNGADFDYTQWKTLRNDEYGFEVKYPSNWTYKADNMKNQPGALPFAYTILIFSNEKSSGQLRLLIQKQDKEQHEKFMADGKPVVREDIIINGAAWTMINPDIAQTWDVEILRQGYLFWFADIYTTGDYDVISHVVKSFRFTK